MEHGRSLTICGGAQDTSDRHSGACSDMNASARYAKFVELHLNSVRVKLPIKVVAGSSRNGVAGWSGNTLRVRVSAPAERGKANAAVEALLNEALGLRRGGARIVSGSTSPRKVVEIIGLSESEVRRRLSGAT